MVNPYRDQFALNTNHRFLFTSWRSDRLLSRERLSTAGRRSIDRDNATQTGVVSPAAPTETSQQTSESQPPQVSANQTTSRIH